MNSQQTRSMRIQDLTKMIIRLIKNEGCSPQQAYDKTFSRACKMVSKRTASEYMEEVVRRASK